MLGVNGTYRGIKPFLRPITFEVTPLLKCGISPVKGNLLEFEALPNNLPASRMAMNSEEIFWRFFVNLSRHFGICLQFLPFPMDSKDPDAAIVSLLTQHQPAIHLYIESLLPGDRAAEDVAQEANSIIWEKRSEFELGTNFKAWAFSIARFQVRKYRFKQAKESRFVFCEELEEVIAEEMADTLEGISDHHLALQECLRKLKAADRDLIYHRYFKKTPLSDYGEKIGRSVGGLKVTLHRVRNRLQTCIEKRLAWQKGLEA